MVGHVLRQRDSHHLPSIKRSHLNSTQHVGPDRIIKPNFQVLRTIRFALLFMSLCLSEAPVFYLNSHHSFSPNTICIFGDKE